MIRRAEAVLGVLMVAAGGVWCLQGLRILPGSFMSGSRFWAVTGALVGLAGIALFLDGVRRPAGGRPAQRQSEVLPADTPRATMSSKR